MWRTEQLGDRSVSHRYGRRTWADRNRPRVLDVAPGLVHESGPVRERDWAPERVAVSDIEQLVAAGVVVAAGHTNARYDQAKAAVAAGMRGVTHLFNAMSPLGSREPGMVGAALDSDGRGERGARGDSRHGPRRPGCRSTPIIGRDGLVRDR